MEAWQSLDLRAASGLAPFARVVVGAVVGADQDFAESAVQQGVVFVGLTSALELLEHVAFCICPLRQQD